MNTGINVEKKEKKPSRDQVAAKAYLLWEKDGRKPGHDLDYWLQAEKQLSARASSPVAASHAGGKAFAMPTAARKELAAARH